MPWHDALSTAQFLRGTQSKASVKAFNYTVTVLREYGGTFGVCGVINPIIVNRD